ncbi:MAG: peptidyl-prolyl cis-trans isomerase [Nitrospirae bacterium]|nr:peptidyl-prolyl cis-trans isomerase [Nitrospirota bacterium]
MNKSLSLLFVISMLFLSASSGFPADQKLPVIDGEEVMATVNNDPITVREFDKMLSSIHSGQSEAKEGTQVSRIDYKGILDRMITMRLIGQEATNIGLNELPDVKEMMEQNSRQTLTGLVKGLYIRGMTADDEEVDRLYKEAVREFKLKSILFDKADAAKKAEEEIKANGNFDEIVKRTIADNTAKGRGEGEYIKGQELVPKIMEEVSRMEIGSISPAIDLSYGFIIFKLEDVRVPENLAAKEEARKQALEYKRKKAFEELKDSLIKKYAKIDAKVLEGLDYETSVEEFEKLLKDTRVVAEIEGEAPITVAELTEALQNKYFHGVEKALKKKKLNDKKRLMLYDELLQKRLLLKEALRQGIDKSPVYKSMVKEYESSLLFDSFLKKVIVPDIKVGEAEERKYYEKNIDQYSSPEMMRISSMVFLKKEDAENSLDALKKGADFKWLSANTERQVDKDAKGLLEFEGTVIITKDLTGDVLKTLSGVKSGDVRLYTSPEKYYYVLYIQDVFPPKPEPFEETRQFISKEIFKDKVNKSIEDWAAKLREVYEVKVYTKEY